MGSDWDMPEARHEPTPGGGRATRHDGRRDGMIDPVAFFVFILRNIFKIGVIAAVLTVIGIMLIKMAPFPYKATATVMVDPRDQRVTLQEDVLSSIGSDAAVLESMVQIMKSDGFLLTVMDQLKLDGAASKPTETEKLEELAKFKKNLSVERKGATYLVEVSYKDDTAQDAARIANSVADAFANTQNGYVIDATQNAARALSERLVELRRKLEASEKAVADFAAEHGILYVDSNNTLEMRQLTELSAQLATAKNATEEARARYQQQLDGGSDGAIISNERNGEPAQLAYLRQQRTQLAQALEQQGLTFGPRHPRIAQTRQAIEAVDRQIREEKQHLTQQLKGALDVAQSRQKKLEADIAKLSSGVVLTDAAEVRLEALRREAAADRDIYEKFLSRNKATDELAELKNEHVKVVSPAVPPLNSSRPSIMLVAPILGLLSAAAATVLLVLANKAGLGTAQPAPRRNSDTTADDAPAYAAGALAEIDEQPLPALEPPHTAEYGRANTSLLMLQERPHPQTPPASEPHDEIHPADAAEDDWRDLETAAAPLPKSLLMMGRTPREQAYRVGAGSAPYHPAR